MVDLGEHAVEIAPGHRPLVAEDVLDLCALAQRELFAFAA